MKEGFPFRRVLSLAMLVDHWREIAQGTGLQAKAAADIVREFESFPELSGPIEDVAVLTEHADLISALMSGVFPRSAAGEVFGAALPPFGGDPVFLTPAFERLGLLQRLHRVVEERGDPRRQLAVIAYQWVLAGHYEGDLEFVAPLDLDVVDPETGLNRHFRLTMDPRFCKPVAVGDLPELSRAEIDALLADRFNIELWMEKLPPALFELQGLNVMYATDVTEQRVLAELTSDLLMRDAMATREKVDGLRQRLRAMMRRPELELGLICVQRDDDDAITGAVPVGRSLLMNDGSVPECPNKADSLYARVAMERQPVFVRDLSCINLPSRFEHHVLEQGIRNIMIAPLEVGDRLVGLFELGSPQPGALHLFNATHLAEVLSLFAIAMQRMLDDRETRVQAVIKQQYTAIHPAVEWRFRRAATNYIAAADSGTYARPEPIVFGDVYPLYGLSDVRGSSTHRAAAIQADLLEQLELARDVISAANRARALPVLAELDHRITSYGKGVTAGLKAGDEVQVLDFLTNELEDIFGQLAEFGGATAAAIQTYHDALDDELGFLYRRRRDFEESISRVNDAIGSYIDREEERAQAMFPHYFERYKTDGVDYNIYIGASLQEDGGFLPIYLRNLRLWQLMMMCGVVWELRRIESELPVPLQVAHLILVQSAPLAIRFRSDEKQFDVDGAYNIRYEIVKKRIDKVHVRGSREQLTQPGRIAIVYSHPREAAEYREYIDFLAASGFCTGEVEDLELEDLQGASGLQALRFTVASDPALGASKPQIVERIQKITRSLSAVRA